jgi:hypothetical protein
MRSDEWKAAAKASAKECSDKDLLAWIEMHLKATTPATDDLMPILLAEKLHRNL